MANFNVKGYKDGNIEEYIELIRSQNSRWNMIPSQYYTKYNVKRGLRNRRRHRRACGLNVNR